MRKLTRLELTSVKSTAKAIAAWQKRKANLEAKKAAIEKDIQTADNTIESFNNTCVNLCGMTPAEALASIKDDETPENTQSNNA